MAFVKFAAEAQVLGFKGRSSADKKSRTASLSKFGEYSNYRTDDDYLYVRVRAISSRVNKNHDGWPSDELQKSWRTFLGKPIFVDHHNSDPAKARGVIVDAAIHVEDMEKTANLDPYYATAPDNHKPPTWIELLLEVDAKTYPKLASAIIAGDIDGVSMGCNVERSKCSHCGNWARSPEEYCKHIVSKGSYFDYQSNGHKVSKRSYEDCYDIGFFEISCVFDPADETALMRDLITAKTSSVRAGVYGEGTLMGGDSGGSYGDPSAIAGMNEHGQFPQVGPEEFPSVPDPQTTEIGRLLNDPRLAQKIATLYQTIMANTNDPETAASMVYEQLKATGADEQMAQQVVGLLYIRFADSLMPGDDIPYSPQPANDYHTPGTMLQDAAGNDPVTSRTSLFGLNEKCKHCGEPLDENQKHPRRCDACGFAQNEPSQKDYLMQHEPGIIRQAERNPLPQSEMMVAPSPVDTMRKEQLCPICGSDMEEGVCQVCNFQEPPEGFDNPNLEKAKERAESQPEPAAPEGPDAGGTPPGGGGAPPASPEMQPSSPQAMSLTGSKTRTNSKVSDEMGQWTVVLTSKTASGNEGGRINTQERPILPATRQNSDKPSGAKTVKDSLKPVESTHKEMAMSQKTADGVGASPGGSGVDAEKRVDVMGVGSVDDSPEKGTQHVNVEKQVDIEKIHTDTWSGDEGDSLGQQEPTTDEVGSGGMTAPIGQPVSHTVTADGAWGSPGEGGGKGFPDHEPTRIDLESDLLEEVGDPTKTWSGTGGNDVYRQQDPTTPDLGSGGMSAPIGEPAPTKSLRSHIFRAMKLAETEVELGLTEDASKWDRAAELEEHTPSELEAVEKTLAKVKTSGLRKAAAAPMRRQASSLPSLQGPRIETEATASGDEQLFLR